MHDGLVFAGISGFPAGIRGVVVALDQATGDIVWIFFTVEDENLWGNPEVNSGGGIWYPPALDAKTGTLYYGVGSPYPFPGAPGFPNATSRPGDNRWTSGTVALDVATGELRWGYQAFPHDLFDRDHVLVALAEAMTDGEDRAVVVTAGKGNVVIGLDPATGAELWATSVGLHSNDDVESFEGGLKVLPGAQGGIVTPISVADGVAYVAAVNAATPYESPEQPSGGEGTELFTLPSNVVAIDIADGTILWDVEIHPDVLGTPAAAGQGVAPPSSAASALFIRWLPGIHTTPPLTAVVPPNRSAFSYNPTSAPSTPAASAAVNPAAPDPRTMMSCVRTASGITVSSPKSGAGIPPE